MRRVAFVFAASMALLASVPARAELVLFREGRVVKAAGYRVVGDELEIDVPGGGSYRVNLSRVDRILDDEVEVTETVELPRPDGDGPDVGYDLSFREARAPLFPSAFDAIILAEAKRWNLDASLVSAVIRAESNFQPRSVSRKGARGLMQLMPATARRFGVDRPFDPRANVRGGVRYLRELADRYAGRPDLVLAAYNAGESAVESFGGVPPYRETVRYVQRILGWWKPAPAGPDGSGSTATSAAASSAASR